MSRVSHAKVEYSGTSRFSLNLIFRPQKREVEGKTIAGTDRGEFTSKKKAKPAVVKSLAKEKWTKLLPPELLHATISITPQIYN